MTKIFGNICFIPVLEIQGLDFSPENTEWLLELGYITNDKAKVTCKECLEVIHA